MQTLYVEYGWYSFCVVIKHIVRKIEQSVYQNIFIGFHRKTSEKLINGIS